MTTGTVLSPVYIAVATIIGTLTIFGNFIVIWVFCRNAKLRKCRNYYIFSLAVADLLVGIVAIPVSILVGDDHNPSLDQYGCLTLLGFGFFFCFGSITSLVAVSIDRLSATHNPVTYHRRRNNLKLTLCNIAAWWTLSFLEAFLIFAFPNDQSWNTLQRCYFTEVINRDYLTFLLITMSIIPAILLICVYTYIYFGIVRKKMAYNNTRASAPPSVIVTLGARNEVLVESRVVREAKNAAKLASLVLVYIMCWTPVHIMYILKAVNGRLSVPNEAMHAGVLLTHCNSMLNPVLYAYYLREFRYPMQRFVLTPYTLIRDRFWPQEAQQRSETERPSRIRNESTSFY